MNVVLKLILFAVVTQIARVPPSDVLMTTIKAAPTTSQVLDAVNANGPQMDHNHILQALCCLFELQKSGKYEIVVIVRGHTLRRQI